MCMKRPIRSWSRVVRAGAVMVLLMAAQGCATYYQSNQSFNQEFESGDLEQALDALRKNAHDGRGKKEFLYLVNNGLVLSLLGRYEESNEFFENAYLFGEDYRRNYLNEAASYLTNPMFTTYKGEDHEHLMLLYYKAVNYLKMNRYEEALVECRRLNIRLQQLSDRYPAQNRYREDAFVHNLMGIIYEADRDYNNAFIAYRNAYRIYQEAYQPLFGVGAPEQLKKDLVRAALRSGMADEYAHWKDTLGVDATLPSSEAAELVFFWHNGLGPIKSEWSVNFILTRQQNWVYFKSPDLNLQFPFNLESYDEKDRNDLASLEVFRVAFPKYVARHPYYERASLAAGDSTYALELAEDINKVAFQSLAQRMHLEFSKALVRAALKKVAEHQLKKSDKTLGSVLGMINALTEKADTRNWQTLPYEIRYTRVPMKVGENKVTFTVHAPREEGAHEFVYQAKAGQTLFHTFTSLESQYPSYSY